MLIEIVVRWGGQPSRFAWTEGFPRVLDLGPRQIDTKPLSGHLLESQLYSRGMMDGRRLGNHGQMFYRVAKGGRDQRHY